LDIKISGFSAERFLNLAVHKGIVFWNIKRDGTSILARINVRDFKKLKPFAKKTKCRIKICAKSGFPFFVNKYRKRKTLVLGMLACIAALYTLSLMVWSIQITGNERIDKQELIQYSIKSGIKTGALKSKLDLRKLEKDFMKEFEDIAWVSIGIKGTKVNIELAETIVQPQIIDRTTPCDVIASKDALIVSIAVKSGTPKVRAKDIVRQGDVLVSGEVIIGEEGIREYVHASAEVKAKIWYQFEIEEELKCQEKVYTGNSKNVYYVQIGNEKFNILNTSILYSNYDKMIEKKELKFGEDFQTSVAIIKEENKEFVFKEKKISQQEAKEILEAEILAVIEKELSDVIEIIDKKVDYEVCEDKIKANITVSTLERIDKQIENGGTVEVEGENTGNTQ